jgi:hypothetical protein
MGLKNLLFVSPEEKAQKDAPPPADSGPAATQFRPAAFVAPAYAPVSAVPTGPVDPAVEAMLQQVVASVPNQNSFTVFSGVLRGLVPIVTIEDQRYRAALTSVGSMGHSKTQVVQSLSAILDALETHAREVHTTAPQKLAEKVGARQAELKQVEEALAARRVEVARLNQEIAQLEGDRGVKFAAVDEERKKSEGKVAAYEATAKAFRAPFETERNKITQYGTGVS